MRRGARFQKRPREFIVVRETGRVFVLIMSDFFHVVRQLQFDPVYFVVDLLRRSPGQRHAVARVGDRDEMRAARDVRKALEVGVAVDRHGVPRVPVAVHHQRVGLHDVEFHSPRGRIDRRHEHSIDGASGGGRVVRRRDGAWRRRGRRVRETEKTYRTKDEHRRENAATHWSALSATVAYEERRQNTTGGGLADGK